MDQDLTPAQFTEVRDDVVHYCQELQSALEQAIPQLAALQVTPASVVETGLQKALNVIELMNSLAAGCVEQVTELVSDVNDTADALWPEGVDSIETLETEIGEASTSLSESIAPCETELKDVEIAFVGHADATELVLVEVAGRLETTMTATENGAKSLLGGVENAVTEHASVVAQHSGEVDRFGDNLVAVVQSAVITPLTDSIADLKHELHVLGADIVREPLREVKSTVESVAAKAENAAAGCFKSFDDAVNGFCEELAGRSEIVGTKARATQELTALVKPIFEGVVQQLPGVKQIADVVGVGV